MGRFASTVAYYESARPPYGAAFFEAVAVQLGLDRSQRLLDVGAGPGILAIGFAPYCREVVGVDPEPAMVEAARAAAERAGVAVSFVEGRFEDVAAEPRRIRHCQYRSRDPLARSRACPSGARSRPRPAGKGSGLRRFKRQRRAQSVARDLQRGARSLEGRSTVARSSYVFRRRPVHAEPERSASRGLTPFPSSAWSNACCRCRPHRRNGSATKSRR